MLTVYVNGLPLPKLLIDLIETGRWKCPADTSALAELTRVRRADQFSFMDVAWMARETAHLRKLADRPEDARLYGLASSRRLARPVVEQHVLDVDLAVMIAVNWDEEAIFLAYRAGRDTPAVVLGWWPEDFSTSYRIIASDFEEFARIIGLPTAGEAEECTAGRQAQTRGCDDAQP